MPINGRWGKVGTNAFLNIHWVDGGVEEKIPTLYLRIFSLRFPSSTHFHSLKNQRQGKPHSGTYHFPTQWSSPFKATKETLYLLFGNCKHNSKKYSVIIYHPITSAFSLSLPSPIHFNFQLHFMCVLFPNSTLLSTSYHITVITHYLFPWHPTSFYSTNISELLF